MRFIAVAFVAIFLIAVPVDAQTLVFADNYSKFKDNYENVTDVWLQQSVYKRAGVFAWAQVSPNYRQAYAGPYIKIAEWLQVGVGGGVEQAKSKARLGSFAYASKGKVSGVAIYEDGGSGPWYSVQTKVAVHSRLSLGTHHQSYDGHGPRAEVSFPIEGTPFTPSVWSSVMWDKATGTKPNVLLGIRLTYFK